MARGRIKLSFFLDQNVPDSIGHYLRNRGHSVYFQRKHIADNSPDQVVAMAAMQSGRILVSWDKDFNSQAFRAPRFDKLQRISLSGSGPTLLPAIKERIDLIEFVFANPPKDGRRVAHVKLGDIRIRET